MDGSTARLSNSLANLDNILQCQLFKKISL